MLTFYLQKRLCEITEDALRADTFYSISVILHGDLFLLYARTSRHTLPLTHASMTDGLKSLFSSEAHQPVTTAYKSDFFLDQ